MDIETEEKYRETTYTLFGYTMHYLKNHGHIYL